MQKRNNKRGAFSRPKVTYDTPGRECVHADKGCCKDCLDPMKTTRVRLRSRTPRERVTFVNE